MRELEVAVSQLQIGSGAHLWEYNVRNIAAPGYNTD